MQAKKHKIGTYEIDIEVNRTVFVLYIFFMKTF